MKKRVKEAKPEAYVKDHFYKNGDTNSVQIKDKSIISLPEKRFEKRKSLLTELYEDNVHTRAVFNIIIAFSIFNIIRITVKEYIYHGRLPAPYHLIYAKFGKLHIVALIWLANNLITFLSYFAFLLWAKLRTKFSWSRNWDICCLTIFLLYYALTFYATPYIIYYFELPFASSLIILAESTRLLMKLHAFVRSNCPKILTPTSGKKLFVPTFGKYLYFLYAPTLVYRDDYPRSEERRWSFAFYRLLDILGVILALSFLFEYFAKPIFQDTCVSPMNLTQFILLILEGAVLSTVMLWLFFAAAIHSIQNSFAEMLRFGDRKFYSDWWNCTTMADFYRKWNWVVGDWLYTYVHKEVIETFRPKLKIIPKVATIAVSALTHEYICAVGAGFFCPIITIMMIFSILLLYINVKNNKNFNRITVMALMPIGPGAIGAFFFIEYFARQNIPNSDSNSVFWSNNCVKF